MLQNNECFAEQKQLSSIDSMPENTLVMLIHWTIIESNKKCEPLERLQTWKMAFGQYLQLAG